MAGKLWRRVRFLFRSARFEEELADEIGFHLEQRAAAAGGTAEARRRFGNPTLIGERSRDVWAWQWLDDALNDLRFAIRLLGKRPGITTVAAVTLALGIGATTAVFSIVDAILLRPLPYKDPDRLVAIWDHSARESDLAKVFAPYTDYEDWRRSARSFESVSAATWAYSPTRVLTGRGPAKQLLAIPVSASFFSTLGTEAALGRTFGPDDEGRGCSVVLSHALWTTAFGADAAVAGQSLTLDQQACLVLGVMPQTFSFYPPATQLWILLGPDFVPPRDKATVGIFARLKRGVTREQAQAEVAALSRAAHPGGFWHDFEPVVYNLHGEFTFLASRTLRVTLLVSFSAVLLVLLIAAMNVAHLLLARVAERQKEFAVRAALGSGQARLVRQVLTESLLLSALGAGGGVALAFAAVGYFRRASPIELTAGADVRINLPVLLFTIGLSAATALVFGALPALGAARIDVIERLKPAGRGTVSGQLQRRAARLMIALEMGLSFLLLTGAGLLMQSALRMSSEPLGFHAERLLKTSSVLPRPKYSEPARRVQFADALLERLAALPGVSGAALATRLPPSASEATAEAIERAGRTVPAGYERHDVGLNAASPGFFRVAGVPLREGREFDSSDRADSAPVAIINEALAREYFPDTNPVGQQVRLVRAPGEPAPWLTIIGVAGNVKHSELMNEMQWVETPVLYQPLAQAPPQRMEIALRAAAGAPPLEHAVQQLIAGLDGSVPVNSLEPARAEISKALAYPRFRAVVLGFFSLCALLLSVVGLHGVLAQLVAQRTPEFGLRMAMGAQPQDLLVLVARQGGVPVLFGLASGIACTLVFSRLLKSLLYGIQPVDPAVLAGISALFLAIATVAIAFPARRATRVDPVVALRDE